MRPVIFLPLLIAVLIPGPLPALCGGYLTPAAVRALVEMRQAEAATPPPQDAPGGAIDTRPLVQFAICLDTSGSMEGLINSARQKLWAITNELAVAEPTPRLEVALLTYGNDGHNPESGWVARHLDFTTDLDAVSGMLFSFVTNGGTELVGRVLKAADEQLAWDAAPGTLRLCFVAGNETADQDGMVPYRDAAARLLARDISVSSIYCGSPEDALAPGWREIAMLADGHFATIDQNNGTLVIPTPFDDPLAKLSAELNETYIPYGAGGAAGQRNQWVQDDNNEALNCDAMAERTLCKATSNYFCSWDLVDMVRDKQIEVTKIVITDLPEAMRTLTIEQVIARVNECQGRRTAIQAKIQALSTERGKFIEAEMAKNSLTAENAFDTAVRTALRERARLKGFRFPGDPAPTPVRITVEAAPNGTEAESVVSSLDSGR